MRNPLNKAIQNTVEESTGINKEFKKVLDVAETLSAQNPQLREEYLRGIETAQEAQRTARAQKENAKTEAEFETACDAEGRARDKEAFFKKRLEALDFTPRMSEEEYFSHVHAVEDVMGKSRDQFRKVAEKALASITRAKAEYLATATDAEKVLRALDESANVLQVKYRYKEKHYLGADPVQIEDMTEWKKHALRFDSVGAYNYAVKQDGYINSLYETAWMSAEQAKRPDRRDLI